VRAAHRATAQPAPAEAARLYDVALDALGRDPTATAQDRHTLLAALIVARKRAGQEKAAWRAVHQAVTLALERGDVVAAAEVAVTVRVAEAESSVSVGALAGDPGARAVFARARADLDVALTALVGRAAGVDSTEIGAAVAAEVQAVENWLTGYADPVVQGDPGSVAPARRAVGRDRGVGYRAARGVTRGVLADELDRAEGAATLRLRLMLVAVLLVMVGAVVLLGRSRSRLLAEVCEPLTALEQVVQRMLRNDPEARAATDRGPREVRAVARVLNDLADAGSRARAVEGRIQDELHVLDGAKDDFVSNVSHELRTPLTTISGYLEMVADEFEGRLEPRHERMLEAGRRNVTRLRALIDDLLALSMAETRPSELEPCDVTEMVTDAVTDVRMTAARRRITLEVAASDEPLAVVCGRAMLYRAFLNVLTNAVKFSPDGATVQVRVSRVAGRVEVAVRDHGIGIPRAELDRLGTRFFRASNAMTHEIAGTGLGLRIVQTIVDHHAGDVVIESAEGEGTTVFIRLRLHAGRAEPTDAP
jgi:signal transduction histidine kinase